MTEKLSSRQLSLQRAAELSGKANEYLEAKKRIPRGMEMQDQFDDSKKRLLEHFQANEDDWNDWKWQLDHIISDVETLSKVINLSEQDKKDLTLLTRKYRWAASPYYTSLMDPNDIYDPIRLMGLPAMAELADESGEMDPMGEEFTNPAGCITRRYPDRLIINVTNQCANYCRFCQRRRNIGQVDHHKPKWMLEKSIEYIRDNPEIRDVLITGGDSFMLDDHMLEWLICSVRAIPHVEVIRLGTRSLVTLPQRITPALCDILKKYHPIYVNTHFNHPKEITPASIKACTNIVDAGIPLGNQSVLLRGINDNTKIMKDLLLKLVKMRVRPYYLYQCDLSQGLGHFRTQVEKGVEIIRNLTGNISGYAIPKFVIDSPHGGGKVPINPEYVISDDGGEIVMRNYEGKIYTYPHIKY